MHQAQQWTMIEWLRGTVYQSGIEREIMKMSELVSVTNVWSKYYVLIENIDQLCLLG